MTKADESPATQTHARAVIWIDHLRARIFPMGLTGVSHEVVEAHLASAHLHHKAGEIGSGRVHDDPAFLAKVTDAVAPCAEVLILGPGNEKTALAHHLQKAHPALSIRTEPCDHLTDGEIIALGRKHFRIV